MVIHSDVEASLRLQCTDLLLTALDNCRDVIQVTDSQDRVIYENNRYSARNLNSTFLEKNIFLRLLFHHFQYRKGSRVFFIRLARKIHMGLSDTGQLD